MYGGYVQVRRWIKRIAERTRQETVKDQKKNSEERRGEEI
jgi:hypothetical protein